MPYTYDYPRPMFTCDVAVLSPGPEGLRVLLVKRGHPPFEGCWALPGGFLDMDEDVPDCAARELREETGLAIPPGDLVFFGLYGAPGRDPRGRVITAVWVATMPAGAEPAAGDDAAEAALFPLDHPPGMAFDHARILEDLETRAPGRR